jgi:hypothetical protein
MNVIAELRINNMTLMVGREALSLFGSRGRIQVYLLDEIVRVKENAFAYRTGHNISSLNMAANGRH